jgi:beta-glucosidase
MSPLREGVLGVNRRMMVVNTTGVADKIPWLNKVPALLQALYSGQESRNAVLDVTFSTVDSSEKLQNPWSREYEHTGYYCYFGWILLSPKRWLIMREFTLNIETSIG